MSQDLGCSFLHVCQEHLDEFKKWLAHKHGDSTKMGLEFLGCHQGVEWWDTFVWLFENHIRPPKGA